MNRRDVFLGFPAAVAGGRGAWAQSTTAVRRVGVITSSTNEPFVAGLKRALRHVGYEEGRNLEIVFRDGRGQQDTIERSVQEVVDAKIDVMVVWATAGVQAAMRATQRIPIVAQVADALSVGVVSNLARPEANVTGVSSQTFEVAGKRVELLLEVMPQARRLAFVGLSGEPNVQRFYEAARPTRPGVEQRLIEVRGIDEIEPAVSAMRTELDGLTVQQIFNPHAAVLAAMAQRLKLPMCGTTRTFTQAGGLMAFESDPEESYRRLAHHVQRVLAGVPVANLPFERVSRFQLSLNLRAAAALDLKMGPMFIARADEVIE